jgi:molybdenum cofactor guanylyltransferase
MIPNPNILGVILAGGSARRMGGGDKGLMDLAGRPMLAHVISRFAPQVSHLILNANGDAGRFAPFGLTVVADAEALSGDGGCGPLAGLMAAMEWAGRLQDVSAIASVSTDVPFLPADLVSRLEAERGSGAAIAASAGRLHPVIGIWPLALRDQVAAALQDGRRSLQAFAKAVNATTVAFPPVSIGGQTIDPFFNANTPDDLTLARTVLAGQPCGDVCKVID